MSRKQFIKLQFIKLGYRKLNNQKGSLTLEAAIIMPIAISLIFFMYYFIYFSFITMQLNQTVSQTVMIMAQLTYPLTVTQSAIEQSSIINKLQEGINQWQARLSPLQLNQDQILKVLQEVSISFMGEEREKWEKVIAGEISLKKELAKALIEPVVKRQLTTKNIATTHLTIRDIYWSPFIENGSQIEGLVGINVELCYPINLPFFKKQFIFSAQAYEKAWLGQ